MNYSSNGRHVKQNPKVSKLGTPILAGILAVTTLTSCMSQKKDPPIKNDIPQHEMINILPNPNTDFVAMLEQTGDEQNFYYDKDTKMMTTDGYVYEYLKQLLGDESLRQEEKFQILNELFDNNQEIVMGVQEYIMSVQRGYDINFVNVQEIIPENIDLVTKSTNLFSYIRKYAKMYQVPEELMIAIATSNIKDGKINYSNVMGIQNNWGKLPSSRTAYNYETQKRDDLSIQQNYYSDSMEQNIKYACMIISQSLKEADGKIDKAIEYYFVGTPTMNRNNYLNGRECFNTVLSYMMSYMKKDSFKLNYTYALTENPVQKTMVFEDANYYLEVYNKIVNQLYVLEQAYSTGKKM